MSRRILIMAGGTGGHIFPGIALAQALSNEGWQVQWLGTPGRMEARLVPQAGFRIHFIQVAGLRGNGLLGYLKAPWALLRAVKTAIAIMREVNPHVVVGMGGFASGPGGVAARLCGVPLVVHEQNAVAGMTNKLLSRFAQKVLMGFAGAFGHHAGDDKYVAVGNPVRAEFTRIAAKQQIETPLKLLVVGGSLGASVFNQVVPEALAEMPPGSVRVHHQTGKGQQQHVSGRYQATGLAGELTQVDEFIQDMAKALAWADVVLCRAGALTVAEVAAAGRAAIFVPYPHAVDDHQRANANYLVAQQAASLINQTDFTSGALSQILQNFIQQPQQLIRMGNKARTLAKTEATDAVVQVCQSLAKREAA